MAKKLSIAVLDACVLIPMPVADTLLLLAEPPALFEARWSDDILEEVTRTLEQRFGKSPEDARYREAAMREFPPGALVVNYRHLIGRMRNHPKDRHVLAVAVACKADYLVTFNLKDFPDSALRELPTAIVGPSAFLKALLSLDRSIVQRRLVEQARDIGVSMDLLLDRLAKSVPGFADAVRKV